ncbi:MAG TPA: glycosyltransferase family 39 protein, partial [bacterium]|nr:glycosyltransferase family 39 protein [bacterium]
MAKKKKSVQLKPAPVKADPSTAQYETSPTLETQKIGNLLSTPVGMGALLIGVPLLVRLLHFLFMLPNPLFRTVVMMDASWYHQQALAIVSGDFAPPDGFFRPPFYSFFLAFVYMVFKPTMNIMMVRLFQCCLGSLNCYLTFRLGERLFSRRVAWIGWIIMAFYGPLFFFDNELLSPVWEVFFNLVLLLSLTFAEGNTSMKWWALAGFCLGMSSITRANILPFLPVMVVWLVWRTKRWLAFEEWRRPALVAVVLALLPGVLVGVRNKVGYGQFIFIAHQGGLTFHVSNNPQADGLSPILPGRPDFTQSDATRIVADETKNPAPSPGQVAEYFSRKATTFIKENPGRFLMLTLKRSYYFLFSSFEGANNIDFDSYAKDSVPKMLFFWRLGRFYFPSGLVIPLMWCGLAMSLPRWRRLSILYLYLFLQFASFVFFFVVARFRLPSVPIWTLFAGQALTAQIGNRNMTQTQFKVFAAALVLLVLLVNADPWGASVRS